MLVNGRPAARIGAGEPSVASIVVEPDRFPAAKPGAVEIALVPDDEIDRTAMAGLVARTRLFECLEPLGGEPVWSFASWAPPVRGFAPTRGTAKGLPTWTRASARLATVPSRAELDLGIAIEGCVLVNGYQVLRTAVAESLPIPLSSDVLIAGDNLIEVFTRDGVTPKSISIRPCD